MSAIPNQKMELQDACQVLYQPAKAHLSPLLDNSKWWWWRTKPVVFALLCAQSLLQPKKCGVLHCSTDGNG